MARTVEAIARDAVDAMFAVGRVPFSPDDPALDELASLYAEGFRRKGFLAALVAEEIRRGVYTERVHEEVRWTWARLSAAGVDTGPVPGIQ